jgi:hypothetical protein
MRTLIIRLLVAPIALMSALPAMAGMAPSAPRPSALVQIAEADASAAEHAAYAETARAELQVWRVKLDEFTASAKDDVKAARKAASDDLNKAWTKTKDASVRLETAGAADSESAKATYKNASDAMAATWTKARADVK